MNSAIFDQVRTIASDLFATPLDNITADSSPQTIETWDSIQHLNLVLAVEEKFGLQLAPEEIEQMSTIGQVTKLVSAKLAATPN